MKEVKEKIIDLEKVYALENPEGKTAFLKEVTVLLSGLNDPLARESLADFVCKRWGCDKQALKLAIISIRHEAFREKSEYLELTREARRGFIDLMRCCDKILAEDRVV